MEARQFANEGRSWGTARPSAPETQIPLEYQLNINKIQVAQNAKVKDLVTLLRSSHGQFRPAKPSFQVCDDLRPEIVMKHMKQKLQALEAFEAFEALEYSKCSKDKPISCHVT